MNSVFLQKHWTFSVAMLSARSYLRSMTCLVLWMLFSIFPRKTLSGELFLPVHQALLSLSIQSPRHCCSNLRLPIS